jgi:monoamine oxidase
LLEAGHDVQVFEARERVGGRVWSSTMVRDGVSHAYERGAEFVLSGYDVLREYVAANRLDLVDTGMSYYIREPVDRPGVTTEDMAELGKRAAELAASIGEPRSAGQVLDWLGIDGPVREALTARIEISSAVSVDEVTAGTLAHIASFKPGPSWRIAGGNQRLPLAMAQRLGDRVRLGTPVRTAIQGETSVLVRTDAGSEIFDHVVVALPFGIVIDERAFSVDLPAWKREALGRVVQGNAAKLHLPLAKVPATSAIMSVSNRYWTWTAVAEGGTVAPLLNCFAGELSHINQLDLHDGGASWAASVRKLRSDLEFDGDSVVLTDWAADPWSRGAYVAHRPQFNSEDAAALAAPVGRVHFAGEYIEPEFTGLMEGALRSGNRAAANILAESAVLV